MSIADTLARLSLRVRADRLPVAWHEAYRLPLPTLATAVGLQTRRADHALWALERVGLRHAVEVLQPAPLSWDDIARVHTAAYVQRLTDPHGLSGVFGLDDPDFPVDATLTTFRVAAAGTLRCARAALARHGPSLNLLGGFHHAARARGWGMCPINDLAITVAMLRAEGFSGHVNVLDLDAHPPDGTADCLAGAPDTWIGSISASDWGPLPGVDEVRLPTGAGDVPYLDALDALLARAPEAALWLVIAGGDVREGDPMGRLALSEAGCRARDERVARRAEGAASVWTPGGGYRDDAWRVLAGTALVLIDARLAPLRAEVEPLPAHFAAVAATLRPEELGLSLELDDDDVAHMLGEPRSAPKRLLGLYTRAGLELGLTRYGLLQQLQRLGYDDVAVDIQRASQGDRLLVTGASRGQRHVLVEAVLAVEALAGQRWLVVHWLNLRHPAGRLPPGRHLLPGQDAPGLGMGDEAVAVLDQMARRLDTAGLLFRPAHLHVAWQAREAFRFLDDTVDADFRALLRDLGHVDLAALSAAAEAGRITRDGAPWAWTPEPMVGLRGQPPATPASARFAMPGTNNRSP